MRIVINQPLAIEAGIDVSAATVLSAIYYCMKNDVFAASINAKGYYVLNRVILIGYVPILDIKHVRICQIVDMLITKGCIIETRLPNEKGAFAVITDKGLSIIASNEEEAPKKAHKEIPEKITEILTYFNEKRLQYLGANRQLKLTALTRKLISARLREYSIEDIKDVIDIKMIQWSSNDKMRDYLTFKTLLNATNFQNYIQHVDIARNNPTQFLNAQKQQQPKPRPDSREALNEIYNNINNQLNNI